MKRAKSKPNGKTKLILGAGGIDPITGRRISDGCWNGGHVGSKSENRCAGYLATGAACECICHIKKQKQPAMCDPDEEMKQSTLFDSGCGTINVK